MPRFLWVHFVELFPVEQLDVMIVQMHTVLLGLVEASVLVLALWIALELPIYSVGSVSNTRHPLWDGFSFSAGQLRCEGRFGGLLRVSPLGIKMAAVLDLLVWLGSIAFSMD
jgi:hypothetical protein